MTRFMILIACVLAHAAGWSLTALGALIMYPIITGDLTAGALSFGIPLMIQGIALVYLGSIPLSRFIRKVVELTRMDIDTDIEQLYEMVSEALSKIDDGAEILYKENKDLRVRVKYLESRNETHEGKWKEHEDRLDSLFDKGQDTLGLLHKISARISNNLISIRNIRDTR